MNTEDDNMSSTFFIVAMCVVVLTALIATAAFAVTDTAQPTIVAVSPVNNKMGVATHDAVTVQFSEPMDSRTINGDTLTVMQTTTAADGEPSSAARSMMIEGVVTYTGLTATFTPINPNAEQSYNPLQPSQRYGNVFTVTVTDGARDLAGNQLSRDYVWSFTTGGDPFAAGAATSQTDQSASSSTGAVAAPTVPPPVAAVPTVSVPAASTSSFPWTGVIIAGVLLLLVVGLLLAFALMSEKNKDAVRSPTDRPNPFGDIHPVVDLEGIGPVYNKRLQAMGIKNTKQLWFASTASVARGTGASLSTVRSWQSMAELSSVKDIGPQYAELIERSGIHSIEQLKSVEPETLLKLIRQKQNSLDVNIQGNSVGEVNVEHWIDEARNHKYSAEA